MCVCGVTGIFAGGKSTVVAFLKKKGAHIFDSDKKVHGYYRDTKSSIYKKTISVFGDDVVTRQGISRKKLAEIVFQSPEKLKLLENIVHPVLIHDLLQWIAARKEKKGVFVAEVPLLFEKGLQDLFDFVIVVSAKKGIVLERAKKRHFSRDQILKRLSLGIPLHKKIRQADFVIQNNGMRHNLKKAVDDLWGKLKI